MIDTNNDKRRHVRQPVNQKVSVKNILADEPVGTIVDVHSEGFLVLGNNYVDAERVYQLELTFSQVVKDSTKMSLGAECLWSREAGTGGQSWIGFHIIDVAQTDKEKLRFIAEQIQE